MPDLNAIQNCKFLPINASTIGDNLVLANPLGPIFIMGIVLVSSAAANVTMKAGTSSKVLFGPIPLVAGGSYSADPTFERWVVGAGSGAGGGFYINIDATTIVTGSLWYKLGK